MLQNLQSDSKYEPKLKAMEIFSWKISKFWFGYTCDQKLLLLTFYVKPYLVCDRLLNGNCKRVNPLNGLGWGLFGLVGLWVDLGGLVGLTDDDDGICFLNRLVFRWWFCREICFI